MKKSNLMTSPPRCSYSSVMIETIFDFKFYIDKISDFMVEAFNQEETSFSYIQKLEFELQKCKVENRLL